MIYKSSDRLVERLLSLPETGMGFQIIQTKTSSGIKKYAFFNSLFGYDLDDFRPYLSKEARWIDFDIDLSNLIHNPKLGAVDGKIDSASGSDIQKFIRLSAFENDLRIDRELGRLLPGSFSTDLEDFLTMDINHFHPNQYYSLPNDMSICWMFYFRSISGDSFQKGTVQPAFGKQGGGREYFFENGTSKGSLISVNPR